MGVRNQCLKIRFALGIERSLPLSISSSVVVYVQSTHMGFISQTSGKVAISAAKYVWITHSGLCNLDHWSGDTAIEVCEIIFLSRPRILKPPCQKAMLWKFG